MKLNLFLIAVCLLAACSNKPKELLAPCNWDQRSNCGKVVALSHQDQL